MVPIVPSGAVEMPLFREPEKFDGQEAASLAASHASHASGVRWGHRGWVGPAWVSFLAARGGLGCLCRSFFDILKVHGFGSCLLGASCWVEVWAF